MNILSKLVYFIKWPFVNLYIYWPSKKVSPSFLTFTKKSEDFVLGTIEHVTFGVAVKCGEEWVTKLPKKIVLIKVKKCSHINLHPNFFVRPTYKDVIIAYKVSKNGN